MMIGLRSDPEATLFLHCRSEVCRAASIVYRNSEIRHLYRWVTVPPIGIPWVDRLDGALRATLPSARHRVFTKRWSDLYLRFFRLSTVRWRPVEVRANRRLYARREA
ncbi:hypothetical protein GCM10009760_52100 [Kitasatospora kazusensis]|uniref:Uncharacterized protein n=1 Tax=Kitasatospora kazusensis TaxID=407974 RepID=A0ABN3A5A8_9ACTN